MKLVKIILSISLIAILLCGCAVADNKVSTNSESSVVSANNSSQNNADDLLKTFISSKKYLEYTTDKHELSYVITDLNADGVNELLMQCEEETEFHDMWLFAIRNDAVSLFFKHYGFGSFRYSPSQNAVIVPPEFRPFIGASHYAFYTLEKGELKLKFSVGETDVEKYSYWTDESKKEITKDEFSAYFTDAVNFEWIKIDN